MQNNRLDRAKQFMPFDALKGFREALHKKEIEYEDRMVLNSEMEDEINLILNNLSNGDIVDIEFYEKNRYHKIIGVIRKISKSDKKIYLDKRVINIKDIKSINLLS